MAQFHHHPDGLIYVRGNDGRTYCDTAANFATDFGEASVLPAGIVERLYDDDKVKGCHHLFDAAYNQLPGGVQPFRLGDLAIHSLELLLGRRAERNVPLLAPEFPATPAQSDRNPSTMPVGKP